jgi:hypothetical protein
MELIDHIKKDFAGIIQKYNLSISAPFPNIVNLENEYCIVKLQLERGIEFYVTFIDKISKRKYGLMGLIDFRKLGEKIEMIESKGLFDIHAKIIELYFSDILQGDFSWSADYDEFMKRYTG